MAAEAQKAAKVPVEGKRNVMVTSALPYVNNVPHLGNIIGCVLSADVFSRYCRLRGYNVIYICGTDEYHAIHKEVYDWFDISFDKFGRTSAPEQTQVCQSIFKNLFDNKLLSEGTVKQHYCDTCERFLADRYVEGTCPTLECEYDSARGDQCDKCGKLLKQTDLTNPRCKVCKKSPRLRDTDHLFLELPLLKDKVEKYINDTSVVGSWSNNAIKITNTRLRDGLEPYCITRDLKWGVPVPHEKYSNKVLYVWFDAPIGYVSITASYTHDWEKWWKNPENVELYQFMGKDNVSFHSIIFPSTLLGTGENWTLPKTISVTEYLKYESGKFSKSNGIGLFGNDVKDTNIPVEVWRYYLLTNRPETSDTDFTWPDLRAKLNSELLNNLGNFINRVLSFIAKPEGQGYNSTIPTVPDDVSGDIHVPTKNLADRVAAYLEQYIEAMEKVNLKQGLKFAMAISHEGNEYLQQTAFWHLYKENLSLCSLVMKTAAGIVYLLACLLEPFMPSFTLEVFKQLNLSVETHLSLSDLDRLKRPWDILSAGHKIGTPKALFKKLKDEEMEFYMNKYAGSQADRIIRAKAEQMKKIKVSDEAKFKVAAEQDISITRLDIPVGVIKKAEKHCGFKFPSLLEEITPTH
ncbi:hypothetical protein TSUD_330490 [Trifolium subterraneum]|nr:hypothetical protein TSUD_330490 [Trifolium subterraneum]